VLIDLLLLRQFDCFFSNAVLLVLIDACLEVLSHPAVLFQHLFPALYIVDVFSFSKCSLVLSSIFYFINLLI